MNKKVYDEKLKQAAEALIGAWPLLRGVVETGWQEFNFRKLDELQQYFDPKQYKFHQMTNKQIEALFAELFFLQLKDEKADEEEFEDFLLVWMDEVFSSEPSPNDNDHKNIARTTKALQADIKKGSDTLFTQVMEQCAKVKKALQFQNGGNPEDDDSDGDYEDVEGEEQDFKKFDHEAVFGSYEQKSKKNDKMTVEVDKEYLPKIEDDEDDEWQQA